MYYLTEKVGLEELGKSKVGSQFGSLGVDETLEVR